MNWMRRIGACLLVVFFATATASAAFLDFELTWSGADLGFPSATATAQLTMDTDNLKNPGSNGSLLGDLGFAPQFDMTLVTNGKTSKFGRQDFELIGLFLNDKLDLSQELVGQPTFEGPFGWDPDFPVGDFNVLPAEPFLAPGGIAHFEIVTFDGFLLRLTSFRPVPEPSLAMLAIPIVLLVGRLWRHGI
jgi:hypothetical protein